MGLRTGPDSAVSDRIPPMRPAACAVGEIPKPPPPAVEVRVARWRNLRPLKARACSRRVGTRGSRHQKGPIREHLPSLGSQNEFRGWSWYPISGVGASGSCIYRAVPLQTLNVSSRDKEGLSAPSYQADVSSPFPNRQAPSNSRSLTQSEHAVLIPLEAPFHTIT